jgi:hypothetical protein
LVESTTLYRKHFNKISDRSLEIILNLYKWLVIIVSFAYKQFPGGYAFRAFSTF